LCSTGLSEWLIGAPTTPPTTAAPVIGTLEGTVPVISPGPVAAQQVEQAHQGQAQDGEIVALDAVEQLHALPLEA
jgi:hypothetical protein